MARQSHVVLRRDGDNGDDKQARFSLTDRRVSMNGYVEWKTLGLPHSLRGVAAAAARPSLARWWSRGRDNYVRQGDARRPPAAIASRRSHCFH